MKPDCFHLRTVRGILGLSGLTGYQIKNGTKRIHMLTAAALLELNFEQPSLDYHSLMKLTKILTRDNEKDMREMFRRMCFNVFAHNRDDHSKNFTYLYDDEKDRWSLSPAYDLTYSNIYYGEHTTTVDGKAYSIPSVIIEKVGTFVPEPTTESIDHGHGHGHGDNGNAGGGAGGR